MSDGISDSWPDRHPDPPAAPPVMTPELMTKACALVMMCQRETGDLAAGLRLALQTHRAAPLRRIPGTRDLHTWDTIEQAIVQSGLELAARQRGDAAGAVASAAREHVKALDARAAVRRAQTDAGAHYAMGDRDRDTRAAVAEAQAACVAADRRAVAALDALRVALRQESTAEPTPTCASCVFTQAIAGVYLPCADCSPQGVASPDDALRTADARLRAELVRTQAELDGLRAWSHARTCERDTFVAKIVQARVAAADLAVDLDHLQHGDGCRSFGDRAGPDDCTCDVGDARRDLDRLRAALRDEDD